MNIVVQGLVWHFWDVPKAILRGWANFLLFCLNYFSIPGLLKTFCSHWRKYRYPYGRIFEVWKNTETIVFNTMSRVIGMLLRAAFIIVGLAAEIFIIIIGAIIFIGWFLLPAFLLAGLIFGIWLLI